MARLEVPRAAVTIERELGSGEFGVVALGRLSNTPVAVKRLKNSVDARQQASFLDEA